MIGWSLKKYKHAHQLMSLVEGRFGALNGSTLTLAWAAIHSIIDEDKNERTSDETKAQAVCSIIEISRSFSQNLVKKKLENG